MQDFGVKNERKEWTSLAKEWFFYMQIAILHQQCTEIIIICVIILKHGWVAYSRVG